MPNEWKQLELFPPKREPDQKSYYVSPSMRRIMKWAVHKVGVVNARRTLEAVLREEKRKR